MLFRRSGRHLLDVIFPFEPLESVSKFDRYSHALYASVHLSRIRKFIFYLEPGDDAKHLTRIFSEPAPNLWSLEFATPLPEGGTIPFPHLFGLEFPKLRVLVVTGVGPWPEVVGANLTRITFNISLDLRVLKRCIPYSPNLKVLKIQGISVFKKSDLSKWRKIILPPGVRLSILYLRVPYSRILTLFTLPRDGQITVTLPLGMPPHIPLLSYTLPLETSHLQNLGALTRLHIRAHFDLSISLELKCFRLDRPAFEVDVMCSRENKTMSQPETSLAMRLLGNLDRIVLTGVEELRMEGFIGNLEPQPPELLAFLERMPALRRVITTNGNEEIFCSALNSLGCRAAVIRV